MLHELLLSGASFLEFFNVSFTTLCCTRIHLQSTYPPTLHCLRRRGLVSGHCGVRRYGKLLLIEWDEMCADVTVCVDRHNIKQQWLHIYTGTLSEPHNESN